MTPPINFMNFADDVTRLCKRNLTESTQKNEFRKLIEQNADENCCSVEEFLKPWILGTDYQPTMDDMYEMVMAEDRLFGKWFDDKHITEEDSLNFSKRAQRLNNRYGIDFVDFAEKIHEASLAKDSNWLLKHNQSPQLYEEEIDEIIETYANRAGLSKKEFTEALTLNQDSIFEKIMHMKTYSLGIDAAGITNKDSSEFLKYANKLSEIFVGEISTLIKN